MIEGSRCTLAYKSEGRYPVWMCKNTNEQCRFIPPSSKACEILYEGGDGLSDEERNKILGINNEPPKSETKKPRRRKAGISA